MQLTGYDDAMALLRQAGQEQVLRFWEGLSDAERRRLLDQVQTLDLAVVRGMAEALRASRHPAAAGSEAIEPAPVCRADKTERQHARLAGEAMLAAGQVAVLLVAGGQGTRLGFDGPKGTFPLAPITEASLFEIHARKVLALEKRYGGTVPFYIMTSEANDRDTRRFFAEHHAFGLDPERLMFFTQGMLPALDEAGRIVLESPGRVAMSPDGHGGVLSAMERTGMLKDMERRGITTLFYFQVDNPLVAIADPEFVGLHMKQGADMSVKVCAKRDASEGLGVAVVRAGRTAIVEYTELTAAQKEARDATGDLRFKFGSVAIHVFSLDFLKRETAAGLPLHIAHKKVPCVDAQGNPIKPTAPNAYKFEKFIFDALPDAERPLILEFERSDEFAPVKNAAGSDSPDTARAAMMAKWARWMEGCGVAVPKTPAGELRYRIEIDPLYAHDERALRLRLAADFRIASDTLLANA